MPFRESWSLSGPFSPSPQAPQCSLSPSCNFENDITELGSEIEHEIDPCDTIGCDKIEVDYQAPIEQIKFLVENSESCEQEIEFSCQGAPLQFDLKNHGYWTDRNGN